MSHLVVLRIKGVKIRVPLEQPGRQHHTALALTRKSRIRRFLQQAGVLRTEPKAHRRMQTFEGNVYGI